MALFVPKSPDYVESNDNEKRYGMVWLHGFFHTAPLCHFDLKGII